MSVRLNKRTRPSLVVLVLFLWFLYYMWLRTSVPQPLKHIPKIIHQSWKTSRLPAKFQYWSDSWRKNHPDWEYRLWSDRDNEEFMKLHFPWFYPTFQNFTKFIYKVDSVRYGYLSVYGGLYIDLVINACIVAYAKDTESIKPIDDLLREEELALGLLGSEVGWHHSIPNAWMASKPGHSFWAHVLKQIMDNAHLQPNIEPEDLTGPVALREAYLSYMRLDMKEPITLVPSDAVYPYNWGHQRDYGKYCSAQSVNFDSTKCKRLVLTQDSVCITYWSHSWDKGGNSNIFTKNGL